MASNVKLWSEAKLKKQPLQKQITLASGASIFERLPLELIEQIISILDQECVPPSARLHFEVPSDCLFRTEHVGPLKCLSLTCRTARNLATPIMFQHLRISTSRITNFMEEYTSGLLGHFTKVTRSVVFFFETKKQYNHEISMLSSYNFDQIIPIRAQMVQMINVLNPQIVTIVAHSYILAWLISHRNDLKETDFLTLPYQFITLEQDSSTSSHGFSKDIDYASQKLSTLRPWIHSTYNKGSFALADRADRSRMHDKVLSSFWLIPQDALEDLIKEFANLKTFLLVAVFPYLHLEEDSYFLQGLSSLEHLTVQFSPLPEDSNNPAASVWPEPKGDPIRNWRDLRLAYGKITYGMRRHVPVANLRCHWSKFTCLDYAWPGYKKQILMFMRTLNYPEHVVDQLRLGLTPDSWKHDGNGTWTKGSETWTRSNASGH